MVLMERRKNNSKTPRYTYLYDINIIYVWSEFREIFGREILEIFAQQNLDNLVLTI